METSGWTDLQAIEPGAGDVSKKSKNVLVGKTLTGMKIATDREALLFQTTDGEIVVLVLQRKFGMARRRFQSEHL